MQTQAASLAADTGIPRRAVARALSAASALSALVAATALFASCLARAGAGGAGSADSSAPGAEPRVARTVEPGAPRKGTPGAPPTVVLRDAPLVAFPGAGNPKAGDAGETDSNSPAHWGGDTLYVFNSAGHPWRSAGPDVLRLGSSYLRVVFDKGANGGRWFECTWKHPGGLLYGWYHNEPLGVCPGSGTHLTAPRIGAARSADDGASWEDLGIVLEAPPGLRCDTANRYFAGGNGDFSSIADEARAYVYFFLSTYGELAEQGVATARMRYEDLDRPAGKVWKWHRGEWKEPGLGGRLTPIFPAQVDWHRKDADAFWGPSVHWNSHLETYVLLLNRAMDSDWNQEGIYVSFNRDLARPEAWTEPRKILDRAELVEKTGIATPWYPQVIGLDAARRETDKLAGRRARLFVRGRSAWEILFLAPGEAAD